MKPRVYIFRGSPAAGKGTVVPEFCKLLPKPTTLISQDALRWGFHSVGRAVSEVGDEEHMFANQNTQMLYEQYLKSGIYTIVVEGLYSWDNETVSQGNAKNLVKLAEQYGFDVKSIVLGADKEVLLARNNSRKYAVPLDEFNMLYDNVYGIIDESEIVLDTTNQTADETVAVLKSLI